MVLPAPARPAHNGHRAHTDRADMVADLREAGALMARATVILGLGERRLIPDVRALLERSVLLLDRAAAALKASTP